MRPQSSKEIDSGHGKNLEALARRPNALRKLSYRMPPPSLRRVHRVNVVGGPLSGVRFRLDGNYSTAGR
jgi:hypothetical protein